MKNTMNTVATPPSAKAIGMPENSAAVVAPPYIKPICKVDTGDP